jgi:hypothetical protein
VLTNLEIKDNLVLKAQKVGRDHLVLLVLKAQLETRASRDLKATEEAMVRMEEEEQ